MGFTHSVAPITLAISNLPSLMSIPIMREAFARTQPWMTERPTPPSPKTAQIDPSVTLEVLSAAPMPVVMPQPRRQAFRGGAFGSILAMEISGRTVYWLKVEVPVKCRIVLPLHVKREVPSGMTPLPCVERIFWHRLVFPLLQNLHSPHSGM